MLHVKVNTLRCICLIIIMSVLKLITCKWPKDDAHRIPADRKVQGKLCSLLCIWQFSDSHQCSLCQHWDTAGALLFSHWYPTVYSTNTLQCISWESLLNCLQTCFPYTAVKKRHKRQNCLLCSRQHNLTAPKCNVMVAWRVTDTITYFSIAYPIPYIDYAHVRTRECTEKNCTKHLITELLPAEWICG